ncbi:hypothetical protein BD413DRAFT_564454 [Trametes elegans]|nr:hypothetical protein BD413DRAFT_564454 [Trametes elegans]
MRPALLVNHPFRRILIENPTIKSDDLDEEYPAQRISYVDSTSAFLTLAEDVEPVVFRSAYAYTGDVSWQADLKISYRFSVAFASTTEMHARPWDGILGLGPSSQQNAFPDITFNSMAPSFPHALYQQSTGIPIDDGMVGLIFYFILRAQVSSVPSILGLNRWPCPKAPRVWSPPIPVSRANAWVVRLKKIGYNHYDLETKTWSAQPAWELKLGHDEQGIDVYLDTGCSLSWLPASMLVHLRTKVMPTRTNLEIDREEGVEPTPMTSTLPHVRDEKRYLDVPTDIGQWSITYTFRGQRGEDVAVIGSCHRFVGDRHPYNIAKTPVMESLIRIAPNHIYILGQPFFNTMYVAMHIPRPHKEDASRDAFVRLSTGEDIDSDRPSNVNPPPEMIL